MKVKLVIPMALVATTLAMGCKKTNSPDENSTDGDTNVSAMQNAKDAVTNAWQGIKNGATNAYDATRQVTTQAWANVRESVQSAAGYGYDKKDAFIADAQSGLASLDQKISALSDKVASASDSVKTNAQAKLQDLKSQRAVLDQKMDGLKNATQADWDDAKAAFENSYGATKDSLKQAWQWLMDKSS